MSRCYEIQFIACGFTGCILFFMCMIVANYKDECDKSKIIYGWLIYYGIYDMLICVNIMSFIHTYHNDRNKIKRFFNFTTLAIIIPNIIIFFVKICLGHVDERTDCNMIKFILHYIHFTIYTFVSFLLLGIRIKMELIQRCSRPDINITATGTTIMPEIVNQRTISNKMVINETNNIEKCIICFETKKMYSLRCKHVFCYECIIKWKNGCMVCRDTVDNLGSFDQRLIVSYTI